MYPFALLAGLSAVHLGLLWGWMGCGVVVDKVSLVVATAFM